MGGFFASASRNDAVIDVFFGTDYHSHLGTRNAGLAVWDEEAGFNRQIHSIENSPFRTKFEDDLQKFKGCSAIGCISDSDPQPLLVRSKLGLYAVATVGIINNYSEIEKYFDERGHQFMAMSSGKINDTELVAALINEKDSFVEGIKNVQERIKGTMSVLILCNDGSIIVSRDFYGRLPVLIGKKEGAHCVSFESFAYKKLGFDDCKELGPGEIVRITADDVEVLAPAGDKMKICAFLWTYYGYPNSTYEGVNVETMRYKDGEIMARDEVFKGKLPKVDFVAGMPDSGIPHAIGFANRSGKYFARPFIKYTPTWPRSFTPTDQSIRNMVAKMKQIPVPELIKGKKLLFVDDSIVRGTQLRETVDFLHENGAEEVHMRSACPPIMYSCKYLNFSRNKSDMDLLARKIVQELEGDEGKQHLDEYANAETERGQCLLETICKKFGFDSLGYQSLDGLIEAIGLDKDKICTYCWTGKE